MKPISFVLIATSVFITCGCHKSDNSVAPDRNVLVEGNWQGTINGTGIVLTFIEGEFESSPTLTGSASLSTGKSYSIMNGTDNRLDSLWFALYQIPLSGKETFHLKGAVRFGIIEGTFAEFDEAGKQVGTGNWHVERIP